MMLGALDQHVLELVDALPEAERRTQMIDLIDRYAGRGVPLSPALRRVFVEHASKFTTARLRSSLVEAMEAQQAELAELTG